MGVGKAVQEPKLLEEAVEFMRNISGQKPITTRAKKAISNFKLRENIGIGCMVTLRGDRMYEFLDRLVSIVIPRFRDFRGLSKKSFDGNGNYAMGIKEQIVFMEVNPDKVTQVLGMDIIICTTAQTNEMGYELLEQLGMPFRKN
jgi:large subunit ribosomal protein L5